MLQIVVDRLDRGEAEPPPAKCTPRTRARWRRSRSCVRRRAGHPAERAIATAVLRPSTYLRASGQTLTVIPPTHVERGAVSLYGAIDAEGTGVDLASPTAICVGAASGSTSAGAGAAADRARLNGPVAHDISASERGEGDWVRPGYDLPTASSATGFRNMNC